MSAKIRVKICVGTTCYVMGGGELLILKDLIPKHLQSLVTIEHVSCLGRCKEFGASAAPLVEVNGNILRACSTVSVLQEIERIAEKVKA